MPNDRRCPGQASFRFFYFPVGAFVRHRNRPISHAACKGLLAHQNIYWRLAAITIWPLPILLGGSEAFASTDIRTGSTYQASTLGSNPNFLGGTLQLNTSTAISSGFSVQDYSTNTIDADGNTVTMSGAFTGTGPLTFTDSVGGGNVILTNSGNTYTGVTTINSGATLSLSGTGTISTSVGLTDNGTFDISATTSGATIVALAGSGSVTLGTETLSLSSGSAAIFSGTITGTGALVLESGTETLAGENTYTGGTTINSAGILEIGNGGTSGSIVGNVVSNGTLEFYRTDNVSFGGVISGTGAVTQLGSGTLTLTAQNSYTGATNITGGTLALSSTGSITTSSSVIANGTFDISATSGASIESLSGIGAVQLGSATLTLTSASGTFSGTIEGSGGITLTGGTETLSGANSYTGATTVMGGTLEYNFSTTSNNISDNATVAFDSALATSMNGIISGSGGVMQIGSGVTTITTAQAYTGTTTISAGTLALSGTGSIASSSGIIDNGTLSIAGTNAGASITSISGVGAVQLGSETLTLTNASGSFAGIISGSGNLTLAGGSETLLGGDTYTGLTTISAGTLSVGSYSALAHSSSVIDNATLDISQSGTIVGTASLVSLSGSGAVTLGANTLVLTAAAGTFSGTISGTGGLTLDGGTETLSGANSYSGMTTISSGTLAISGAGGLSSGNSVTNNGTLDLSAISPTATITLASLSGSGQVILGAENLNLANASGTFSGTISGSGQLIVSGGVEVLAGANSFTGGTLISGGTLQIGSGSLTGSVMGNIIDNGILAFDPAGNYVFAGTVSGAGSVQQTGLGTTILTAADPYTGGTTITSGTLQLGNGSAAGSITGDVTDNGTLAFDRPDNVVFGGVISGTGAVTVEDGTVTLAAADTYTGVTTVNGLTTLALSGSGSIDNSQNITDNGTFDISAAAAPQIESLAGSGTVNLGSQSLTLTNASGTFSGTITGSGGLVLNGGTQILSGTNAYNGATTVNGGTLLIDGSVTSSSGITVNSGGTLGGTGFVPGVTVNRGGSIAPGANGAGALNVNGTVALNAGSNFIVNVNSATAPTLSTSGAEVLAGTLSIASTDGTYPLEQKLTILTAAGGVTGAFASAPIQSSGAQFVSALSYDAKDAYLEISLSKLSPLLPRTATGNQKNAIGGIDAAIANSDTLPPAFENLGNVSSTALGGDAGQLSGEIAADVSQAGLSLFNPFLTAVQDHIADMQHTDSSQSRQPSQRPEIWLSGFVGSSLVAGDADIGSHNFRSNVDGFVMGGDWNIEPRIVLGAAASIGFSNFHIADDLGRGTATAYQFSGYSLLQFSRRLYGSFTGAAALDDINTNRTVTASGTDDLTGKAAAWIFGGRYETGVSLNWITPYLALQDDLFNNPSYGEQAASGTNDYAISYRSGSTNSASLEFGERQRADLRLDQWTLKLSDRLAWAHGSSGTPGADGVFSALPGSVFTVYGASSVKDAALISLGADLENRRGIGIDLHFDSAIAHNSQTYTGIVGLNFAW